MHKQTWISIIILTLLLAVASTTAAQDAPRTEILWDNWGVPYVYAETELDLAYGFGWAQMD